MEFYGSHPYSPADDDPGISKIGALVGIMKTGKNDAERVAGSDGKFAFVEVLKLPDELQEPFGHHNGFKG